MDVEINDAREDSCNFCTPTYEKDQRIFDYDYVYGFRRDHNNGLYAVICPNCLAELVSKVAKLED